MKALRAAAGWSAVKQDTMLREFEEVIIEVRKGL